VQRALATRGVDEVRAESAAQGCRSLALIIDDLTPDILRTLAQEARVSGLDCLAGDDWVFLSGGAATLAGLARPDSTELPASLASGLAEVLRAAIEPPLTWSMQRGTVSFDRPVIVAILNVTPDSFSDGGRFLDPDAALRHAEQLIEDGADMLDVGAESTRPGRPAAVDAEEEWNRLHPVLEALAREHPDLPVSVDTVKAETARRALDGGAWVINDVSGLRLDPEIATACAAHGAGLVLMHSRGTVADMASYDHAHYHDVGIEVRHELAAAAETALGRGLAREQIVVDPGLGFAKTPEHTFQILRELPAVVSLGFPVMVGPSRKRFLGDATSRDVEGRDVATAAACVAAYFHGANLFRVHAVTPTRDALRVARAVRSS
jgi:dihydropteroate synthase